MGSDLYTQPGIIPHFNGLNPSPTAPPVIGLAGYARSGKDTTAEIITNLFGYKQVSFAAKLKALAYDVNNYVAFPTTDKIRMNEVVDRIGWEEAKEVPEVRRILQALGTKVRQHLGANTWIDAAFLDLDWDDYPGFVFSDVRFPNEANAIQDENGVVLRVVRSGVDALNDHVSETAMNNYPFDGVIENFGSILDLEGEVQRVLGEFS